MSDLPFHFVELVQDTLLKSIWRKNTLLTFLRRHKIQESLLSSWQETETKRVFLSRILPQVEASDGGAQLIKQMAVTLADQIKFPDLEGWEDAAVKIKNASESVASLRHYLDLHQRKAEEIKGHDAVVAEARKQQQVAISKRQTLETLSVRLAELSQRMGTQAAGYEFQDWFYDLVGLFEIEHRRPYVSTGRQIDGSITVEGTTYLTELKFTKEQAGATDVDTFLAKVNDKADNTMGIMVSMSGYSSTAIQQASGRKTPLILMDYSHIYQVLGGTWTLTEIIGRLRRHASQTGVSFLPATDF
ncbi:hypothetical protein OpiT1DRAFT_04547 [Opitutaceae bacterium TAV1]|nr:hypothetical protein OpiT1DRAFT_04547 [Opitutaceae bacterium TAV1]